MEPWAQIDTLNATWVEAGAGGGPLRFGNLYCLLFGNSGLRTHLKQSLLLALSEKREKEDGNERFFYNDFLQFF